MSRTILVSVVGLLSFAMWVQGLEKPLSLTAYLVLTGALVALICLACLFFSEKIAFVSLFVYALSKVMVYFLTTGFAILPFGDAYGEYGAFSLFNQAGHIFLISSQASGTTALGMNTYSAWPGLQIVAINFAAMTGLGELNVAIWLPVLFYAGWILIGYLLLKKVFSSVQSSIRNLPVLVEMLAVSEPYSWLVNFKYDVLGTILLTTTVVLLVILLERKQRREVLPILILTSALAMVHHYTALISIIFFGMAVALSAVGAIARKSKRIRFLPLLESGRAIQSLLILIVLVTFAWWSFYSSMVWEFIYQSGTFLQLFTGFAFERVTPIIQSGLTVLTPSVLNSFLEFRNALLIALLGTGILVLLFRPSVVQSRNIPAILLIVGLMIGVGEVLPTIGVEGRAALLFSAPLAAILILPLLVVRGRPQQLAILTVVFIFGFSGSFGYWGLSYAPLYLYAPGVAPSSFGEHPSDYGAAMALVNQTTVGSCVFSNEVYVMALRLPVSSWGGLNLIGQQSMNGGCVVVVFDKIATFNSSYVPEEPSTPGFSYAKLLANLQGPSSTLAISAGENANVYYIITPIPA